MEPSRAVVTATEKGNETNYTFKVVVVEARDKMTGSSFQGPGKRIRTHDRESSTITSFVAF